MIAWSKIVCAVDFSESSRIALEHSADLARRFEADLVLAHVAKGSRITEGRIAPAPAGALTVEEESELTRKLYGWKREAERTSGGEVRTVLSSGSPIPEIVRIASEEKADLVVVGTRGRTGFERAVLGSVAEGIVRVSRIAVLVTPPAREWGE
jgi:nucleotide-binding universal stress UspA family protein